MIDQEPIEPKYQNMTLHILHDELKLYIKVNTIEGKYEGRMDYMDQFVELHQKLYGGV